MLDKAEVAFYLTDTICFINSVLSTKSVWDGFNFLHSSLVLCFRFVIKTMLITHRHFDVLDIDK